MVWERRGLGGSNMWVSGSENMLGQGHSGFSVITKCHQKLGLSKDRLEPGWWTVFTGPAPGTVMKGDTAQTCAVHIDCGACGIRMGLSRVSLWFNEWPEVTDLRPAKQPLENTLVNSHTGSIIVTVHMGGIFTGVPFKKVVLLDKY